LQGELVKDFSGVFRRVLHCIHAGCLFGSTGVEQGAVHGGSHVEFKEIILGVLEFRFDGFVLCDELELREENGTRKQIASSLELRHGVLKLVVNECDLIVIGSCFSNLV
jgi:hypothetical protein